METERLILREWKESDLKPFAEIVADPRVMEFLLKPLTWDEAAAWIQKAQRNIERDGFGFWACELKETSELIGFVGLSILDFESHFTPCVEIGWRLAHHAWGKGYALEAAQACLEAGFHQYGLKEIVAITVPANIRSRRVMEKLGMTRDPADDFHHPKLPFDHPLSLHVLYRITKEQFEKT